MSVSFTDRWVESNCLKLTSRHNRQVEGRSLEGSFEAILPGDAVIAFSKKSIFNIRAAIESSSGHRCCVVRGLLWPTGSDQSRGHPSC